MPPRSNGRINLPLNERIKDGRIFEVNVIYLRCQTRHCRGTAKKLSNGDIVLAHEHSSICFDDNLSQLKVDFKHALKSALKSNYWRLKNVYESIALMYPSEVKIEIPYNSIKSSLKKCRRNAFPPNPTSLEEMAIALEQPRSSRLLEYDVGRLVCLRITDSLGEVHVLLYNPQFVETEFRRVLGHSSGYYRVASSGYYQSQRG